MGNLVVVGVKYPEGLDEVPLARRFCRHRLGLLKGSEAKRKIGGRRRIMRIVEVAQSNGPVGNTALRISLDDVFEYASGFPIPERVLISHAAIEPALCGLVARCC